MGNSKYQKAADKGHGLAQYDLADVFRFIGQREEFEHYRDLAAQQGYYFCEEESEEEVTD